MQLPKNSLYCIQQLEAAGFAAYAVGGCVRDHLLGLTPHDFDLCTSATPAQMRALFSEFPLVRSGEKHGTIGVVLDGEVLEITTFRTEGDYTDSRHPDWVAFVTDIREDLSRRDFTINAMAYSPTRGLMDPFGGREDLKNHILRAVGHPEKRFTEDALRILRGVRFAVRYGLTPDPATEAAMKNTAPWMAHLARERIFDELCKLLPLINAAELLHFAPILTQVLPELAPTVGFRQHSPHHAYDVFTHTAHVVASVPRELPLRWAALLHDVGKPSTFTLDEQGQGHFYGHAKVSAQLADSILLGLKAPNALRKTVTELVAQHMTPLEPDKRLLKRRMSRLGTQRVQQLLALQRADFGSKGKEKVSYFDEIQQLITEILQENACLKLSDLAVGGHELMALGLEGKKIGQALNQLLSLVLDEQLSNQQEALLAYVKENLL